MRRRIQISPSRMRAVICIRYLPQAAKHLLTNKNPETLDNRCTDVIPLQQTIHESQTRLLTKKTRNQPKFPTITILGILLILIYLRLLSCLFNLFGLLEG